MIMAQVNSPESLDRVPSDHLEIGDELAIVPRKLSLVLNWQSRPINYGGHDVVRAEDATAVWETMPGVQLFQCGSPAALIRVPNDAEFRCSPLGTPKPDRPWRWGD